MVTVAAVTAWCVGLALGLTAGIVWGLALGSGAAQPAVGTDGQEARVCRR